MEAAHSLPVSKRDLDLIGDGLELTLKLDGLNSDQRDEILSLLERVDQLATETR